MAMESFEDDIKGIVLQLFDIGALKFGNFKMKVGINSPVYFDLRIMVSYPPLMEKLADLVWRYAQSIGIEATVLCGVPYTALPVATLVSVKSGLPMLIRRKEPKAYGTMKLIEGKFSQGEECLIIEDVVTSGGSILETAKDLVNDGLVVQHAIIMVDREQGGKRNLTDRGIRMHSLLSLSKALSILLENGKLDQKKVGEVREYIAANQVFSNEDLIPKRRLWLSYSERSALAKNPLACRILQLMGEKKSNLCVALDVPNWSELVRLVNLIGSDAVVVKTHYDYIKDWKPSCQDELTKLAAAHNFIVLEDRKLGDIGNTIMGQFETLTSWADGLTMHSICGGDSLKAVREAKVDSRPHGVFVVAELSSQGNLISAPYTKKTTELAKEFEDVVAGLVAQNPLLENEPGFVQLTPGVSLKAGGDNLGQKYVTPSDAVLARGGDLIVVGRAITRSINPKETARQIRQELWSAYERRIAEGQTSGS
ncbi:uridine 5'-monophosphate synthase [Nesidiocoris tenuis]|uniref:Uridine 5'-monophosphate synthase n=1 Tax=Nesidiocoris tenuis TaxID=355587 RepID=A0ABN7BAT9_9HEMI|nr:uridine 5'-monophosphate synthase [Nesidiocoris tenuis]